MKRYIVFATLLALAFVAVACAGPAPTGVPSPTSAAVQPTVAPTKPAATTAPTPVPTTAPAVPPKWIKWHDPAAEKDELFKVMNGTGPFKLQRWTPGEEIVLVRNDNYWRKDPIWEGGPKGPAALKQVTIKEVDEWGTRFAMLKAGDADHVTTDPQFYPQVDPLVKEDCDYKIGTTNCTPVNAAGTLRRFKGLFGTNATDVFFNQKVNVEGGNNYVGTGALDGNGIPPTFFTDVHIRKAFNYCFDWDAYIKQVLTGLGVARNGPVIQPMLGYNPNGPAYKLDLAKCAEEFKASTWKTADGKSTLWDVGFYMQITYNTGNLTRKSIAEILQKNITAVNPKFKIEVYSLPWPVFLKERTAGRYPVYSIGWQEDYHDPHNWVVPYLASYGTFNPRFAPDIAKQFDDLIKKAATSIDTKQREATYFDIQKLAYDLAPSIYLAQVTAYRYEQPSVQGWYFNPIYGTMWWYPISKDSKAKNPDTYVWATIGDVESFDPAYTYETFGAGLEANVYDSMLWYKKDSYTEFVPALAEKWDISSDGKTLTFYIRKGVKFHEGQDLKPEDIAYSIQRGLLQDRTDGPQWVLLQPIFDVTSIAELAAKEAGLKETPEKIETIPAAGLVKACQDVQKAVTYDNDKGTVTITLNAPFGPILQILAQPWGAALSKEWVIKQGGWDGTCN